MKNEERIIELLVETLQKVDRHQQILEEHIRQWKEQNQRWNEQNQRWDNQNQHWDDQHATSVDTLRLLGMQMTEIQKLSAGLTQNDQIDHEQSKRIEMLHQSSLEEQRVIRDMLSLLMTQNKALKDNNLL